MSIRSEEKISFYTHFFGAISALVGLAFLIHLSFGNSNFMIISFVYGLSVFFLFSASSLYHALKKAENEISFWRKLDHVAIFFMIAGSYTPICYMFLDGYWQVGAIVLQWTLVFLGLLFKLFFLNAPRFLNTSVYLMMGWMAIVLMKMLYSSMSILSFVLLMAGALAYTVGAVIYGLKKPILFSGRFGFHEIFHVFILIGAALHFFMIYFGISSFIK